MRDNLNASEKRLIAALDRIDHFLDRTGLMPAAAVTSGIEAELRQAQGENERLSQELLHLHERQATEMEECEARLLDMQGRLQATGQEAARLSSANEALAAANRALTAGTGQPADDARRALEAEVESLRAARAAEIAQMGDIVDALDRMIGTSAPEAVEARLSGDNNLSAAEDATAASAPGPAPAVMLETPPMPRAIAERPIAGEDGAGETELQGDDEERG